MPTIHASRYVRAGLPERQKGAPQRNAMIAAIEAISLILRSAKLTVPIHVGRSSWSATCMRDTEFS